MISRESRMFVESANLFSTLKLIYIYMYVYSIFNDYLTKELNRASTC